MTESACSATPKFSSRAKTRRAPVTAQAPSIRVKPSGLSRVSSPSCTVQCLLNSEPDTSACHSFPAPPMNCPVLRLAMR